MKSLNKKVAIITGAGQGIGEAIASKLAAEGSRVVIAEINSQTGTECALKIKQAGGQALFIRTDITKETEIKAMVAKTILTFGSLDILVNNAGKNVFYNAVNMTEAEWDATMNLDLKAAWLCAKHAIPEMLKNGNGSIINIASIHARLTIPGMFPYAAVKSGLIGLTRSLALDWGPKKIRVNAICPGWVRTKLVDEWLQMQADPISAEKEVNRVHALRRMAQPEEIANFVAFIASNEASFITGAELYIDGGLSAQFAT